MICKYYLKIGVTEIGDNLEGCIDCTGMVCNADDINVSYKRTSPMGGVVRTCSSSIVFCNQAKDLLYEEYLNNYLNSKAAFALCTINNDWTYSKEYECPLDFSTMQYDGNTIELNSVDQSVAAIIKANKSVKYEFQTSEIKESKLLYYDRIDLVETADYMCVGDNNTEDTDTKKISLGYTKCYLVDGEIPACYKHVFLPIYVTGTEMIFNALSVNDEQKYGYDDNSSWGIWKDHSNLNNKGEGTLTKSESRYIIKADNIEKSINLSFHLSGTISRKFSGGTSSGQNYTFKMNSPVMINIVHGIDLGESGYNYESLYSHPVYLDKYTVDMFTIDKDMEVKLSLGEIIGVVVTIPYMQCQEDLYVGHSEAVDLTIFEEAISVSYTTKGEPVFIDVIRPQVLLDSILSKFNLVGRIDFGSSYLQNSVIVAAESIRGIYNAKLYTSFSDFCKWLEAVFGFIYVIENEEIVFKHRDELFGADIVLDLSEHVNNLSLYLDSSNIYSLIRVGYNKQDYDSINGRDEFRFTNEYTTGVDITENKLELISPYRADAYGFEFLCQKRGEKSTDDESDSDIFFLNVDEKDNNYELHRTLISGVLSPDSMFNQVFTSSNVVRVNKNYIGMFAKKLFFASSEGNSDVVIDNIAENSDIEIISSLATVGRIKVDSDILELPDGAFTGLFSFLFKGYRYMFYLDNVDFNYQREQCATYEGIIKSIEKL